MIINHNIAALNTFGRLSANNTQQGKALEKLSSGFRINRAGDDAAGLAISEKMRGQIRGLDQASRNAQDGISLIQTAEGALTETHSILQRMKELATQAANGTNTDNDRAEIQKEINALSSEINRIGNTTEFNTQKLLNGGGVESTVSVTTTTSGAGLGEISGVSTNGAVNISEISASTAGVAAVWDTTITNGGAFSAGTGTITFGGVTLTVDMDNLGDTTGANSSITATSGTLTIDKDATAAQVATGIINAFTAIKTAGGADSVLSDFTFSNSAAGHVTVTAGTKGDQYNTGALDFTNTSNGITTGDLAAPSTTGVDEVRGEYAFTIDTAIEAAGATIAIGGQTFTAVASGATGDQFNVGTDEEAQAISLAQAINNNSTLNARFDALVTDNKVTLREKTGQATGVDLASVTLGSNTAVQGVYSFNVDDLVAVGGKYEIDGVSIEVTDDPENAGIANGTAVLYDSTTNGQAANLKNAITANATLGAKYSAAVSNTTITLTQKSGQESMTATDVTTNTNANDSFQSKLQVGANTAQSMTLTFNDMRSVALKITGTDATNNSVTASNGSVAHYVTTANVTNGTTNTNVELALDVSTHDKATAAISVLDDAIATVSAQRSQLGAFQNRLEHTINNLEASSENLTAAESRIRDVDMAKQMMEYTKFNILSQASTAMLAQANQLPQGVLQLLK